ncbi:thioesterase II family protein [Streptomyces marianii]|uniref:thioesterase II family protein n=1 Tax=Streptomyces marianii TaxID=1817406 RepID=UPI001F248C69|nr:alpha/beta fold hydrolase [Streptomyces marianii]
MEELRGAELVGVSQERNLWLRRFHTVERGDGPAGEPAFELICFPHAGGSAAYWRGLAAELAPAVDVLAVQYPGRLDRLHEAPVEDLHRLADLVVAELGPQGERPRALLGHSMGASLAYEVAVRLARVPGREPLLLVLSCRRAPDAARRRPRDWPRDDAELIARVRTLGGTESALLDDPELLGVILPALRGDYRALASYEPTPGRTLSCPVVALTGDRDAEVPVEDLRAWRECTSGDFRTRVFEGGHFFLNDHVGEVAALIRGMLPASAG